MPVLIWVWWLTCFWLVWLPPPLVGWVTDGWSGCPPEPPPGRCRGKPLSTSGDDPHPVLASGKATIRHDKLTSACGEGFR